MNVSLYQAAAAMNAHARWQEALSGNLASASIPGFKKQNLSFEAIEAGRMGHELQSPSFLLPRATASTSFAPGELRSTGVPTDLGIQGQGFFEVQLADGSLAYTRDGEFHQDPQGQLVTKQGFLVMGQSGPIELNRNRSEPITITGVGEVNQGTESRGKIKVIDFDRPELLVPLSGGLFSAANTPLAPTEVSAPAIRQGFLESANTSPVMEMASLLQVMRAFETNQRVVQMQDERMGRVISELGNPV